MEIAFEQVLNLKDSVEYQPGAVIRKTIIQKEMGSAKLVAPMEKRERRTQIRLPR